MRRILVAALAGLLTAALAPVGGARASLLPVPPTLRTPGALPAVPAPPRLVPPPAAHVPAAPAAVSHAGTGPHRQSLSSALALGLPGLDALAGGGDDDAGVRDAFPGSGVPRAPAGPACLRCSSTT